MSGLSKYWQVVKLTFESYTTYRLNFIIWRFRNLIGFATLLFFWTAIYTDRTTILGYDKSQIIAYVLGVSVLRAIVLSSKTADLAGQIRSGELSFSLLKPLGVFRYFFFRDVGDKLVNLVFSLVEICLIISLFQLPFYLPHSLSTFILFLLLTLISCFIYFFFSLITSLTGFWTEDVWATRWLFDVIFLQFMAGSFFPVDILPAWLSKIFYLTPFPLLIFFPVKVWNEQLSPQAVVQILVVALVWLAVFALFARYLWNLGRRHFGAYGG